ncbi:hypothetical protein BJ322DRAFT_1108325 [Thelephora terrestris]|uniref:Uncharacterized protein n=1 Tax=Thelephora terrestris TaxID=56493 RepID=A0A9P6HGB6_9AGAM|nr:hypothetical protein BJ322DRAFT_1108325 [Thelephora terrestris]
MRSTGSVKLLLFVSFFFVSVSASDTFTQCLETFRTNGNATGGTDFFGRPVNDSRDAVGLTYEQCMASCGTGQESFSWSVFSQQFSAWLLPWLALVSQLPFGAESRIDNLISVALTVGSPTLAAFSLVITALNTRWANDRFSAIKYPNHENAAKALIYLQQVPLRLTTRDGLLASLIIIPENDDWWDCLVDRLQQTYTWTIAAATSVAWVIIAFIFTIADSVMNLGNNVNSSGQGAGILWLWLVPMVVGWLWVPVCSFEKLRAAIDKANEIAFVATPEEPAQANYAPEINPPRLANEVSHMQGIRMHNKKGVFTQDAARTAPVFNYARIWEWHSAVEMIAQAFESADRMAKRHTPVNSGNEWTFAEERRVTHHRDNRIGSLGQVQAYCGFDGPEDERTPPMPSGVWKRIFVASLFALGLQWSTTASAAITVLFTPTTGLGCRSGSYILYGIVSTMIWLTLLLSSYLAHLAKLHHHDRGDSSSSGFDFANLAEGLATFLRRLSTFAAVCNTLCIILACVFQFSDVFSTCYCNSSVLGRGAQHAYNVIAPGYDYDITRAAWIGGIILASGYAVLFLFALHLILELSNDIINN